MNLLNAAKLYAKNGLSVIATDAVKRSLFGWKKYQADIATEDELQSMFSNNRAVGVAIICGEVSGNLEVIDVDCKYDLTSSLWQDFIQSIVDVDPELAASLVIATTANKGYHIMYRCIEIEGNKKFASRHTTIDERKDNPHEKVKVLIESRGEAGYVIAAPTDGYKFIQHSIKQIPTITPTQRLSIIEAAFSFNQVFEEHHSNSNFIETRSFSKSPFADYNQRGDIIGLLQKHGWKVVKETVDKTTFLRPGETKSKSSGDYSRKHGLFSVFTTSSEFEPMKGYRPSTIYSLLEFGGDFKAAAKQLLTDGYGEPYKKISKEIRQFVNKQKDDGIVGERLVTKVASEFNVTIEEAKSTVHSLEHQSNAAEDVFWYWDIDKEKLGIIYTRFARFLENNGFGLFFYDKQSPIFKVIHNDNNRLEEASVERIKKFTQKFVTNYDLQGVEYTKEQLLELVYRNNNIFSDSLFEFLNPVQLDFLTDSKDDCYIPFKKGIVKINKDDVQLLKYGQVNKVIWKSDLIDFNIDIVQDDDNGCEFMDFISKICNEDEPRLLYVVSVIGYLLHKYKHPAKAFAVILAEETDDDSKGGGTGKGIVIKAIEKILNTETIDGKNFKPDKSFAYQRVKLETKMVAIQDVEQNFDFKKFYSIITEGWTIEKKNKDELYLNYQDSPKVILTTNYTINDDGNHAKRRQKVVEFSNYFGPDKTPLDEYGHLLFEDWDKDEWNRFYNFMFYCIQYYLKNGIGVMPQGDKYKHKKIKVQFGEDFLSWFNDNTDSLISWKKFNDLYSDFLNVNNYDKKDFSRKRFKKGVEIASENFGYELLTEAKRQDNNMVYIKMLKK
jgi:hypothetical protein